MRPAAAIFCLLAVLALPATAAARDLHGVPLPSGTRALPGGDQSSGLNFRKTVDFYRRFLKRAGTAHEEARPYRHRSVVVARFISKSPTTPWAAIHVFQTRGQTRIYVVPLDPNPPKS
jgi:hypothetical protein